MNELTPLPQLAAEIKELTVDEIFEELKQMILSGHSDDIFDMFFGKKQSRFIGGCGDSRRTLHEQLLALMGSKLRKQVVFGTGKNGLKKYGSKRFIADFVDDEDKTVLEVDGSSHKSIKARIRDLKKEKCLLDLYGYGTVRLTNEMVESIVKDWLLKAKKQGVLRDVLAYFDSRMNRLMCGGWRVV